MAQNRTTHENECSFSLGPAEELTGGLEALDVPGGAQEEAAQKEEEEEEGQHRDQDPGDHRHRHGDHTQDLQEHLQRKQQQLFKIILKGRRRKKDE